MTTPLDPEALAASDPRTPPAELTRIASSRPDLHSAIYANPSTHLELKQWLEIYYPDAVRNAAAFAAGSVAITQQYPAIPQYHPATQFGSQAGAPEQQPEGRRRIAAWVALGVTVSLLVVGGVYGVRYLRSDSAEPAPAATSAAPAATGTASAEDSEAARDAEREDPPTIEPESTTTPSPAADSASSGPRPLAPGPGTPSSKQTAAKGQSYLVVDSDSTNFSCEMYGDWVGCSVLALFPSIMYNSQVMKSSIHPQDYRPVVFSDEEAGFAFLTQSTAQTKETIKWEDGNEYPLVKIHISSASHPFFTGEGKIIDTEGRVDRFKARFAAAEAHKKAQLEKKKKAEASKKAAPKKAVKAEKTTEKSV